MFKTLKISTKKLILITPALLFFLSIDTVHANQSFGLFSPKIEYVDDSATANCSSDEASIELHLVNRDTQNLISNSIGNWSVKLKRSLSDQTEILVKNYNNANKSEVICFDPVLNGLQVIVLPSSNYKAFSSPAIFPDNSNTSALEAMRGSHFRGYVQLSPSSETTPDTTSLYPNNGDIATSTVEFLVQTNRLTSLYSVSKVNKIKLYLENQLTGDLYTKEVTTNGGVGVRSISAPAGLPDGRYFWSFHQEFDGDSTTQRLTFPEWTWTFGNIPVSGLPNLKSITIDSTPPVATIDEFKVVSEDSPDLVTISFNQNVNDTFAGVSNSQLYIEDITDGYTYGVFPMSYPAYTTSSTTTFVLSSINKDHTYRLYIISYDAFNNTSTSANFDYNIPLILNPPIVDLYTGQGVINGVQGVTNSTAWLYGTTTDSATNYLSVTEIGSCWSTSTSIINSTSTLLTDGNCITSTSGYSDSNASFHFYTTNLPASSTVYFRMMAKNDVGWGFSSVGSFTTNVSPFDPTAGPTSLPQVVYISPTSIQPDSLNPNLRLDSAGNMPIHEYGICYSTDQDSINNIELLKFNTSSSTYDSTYRNDSWGSKCRFYGSMPLTTQLPFSPSTQTFSGLFAETDYYFVAFAINDLGAGKVTGTAKTSELNYLFKIYNGWDFAPEVIVNPDDFNESNDTYSKIKVSFGGVDESFDLSAYCNPFQASCAREIPYLVTVDIGNDLTVDYSVDGTMKIVKQGSSPKPYGFVIDEERITNLPINTPIRITVKINEPESLYPQTNEAVKTWSELITLNNPNSIADSSTGTGSDSGSALDVDPEFMFSTTPSVIRPNSTTTILWDMKSIDIDCAIEGPSNFTPVSFNPSEENGGVIDSNVRVQGVVESSTIKNTQVFNLSCTNLIRTYSTTTRINVVGNPSEF